MNRRRMSEGSVGLVAAEGNVPAPAGEAGSPAPRYGNGRTEAQEKADDSAWIHAGMAAAFPVGDAESTASPEQRQ